VSKELQRRHSEGATTSPSRKRYGMEKRCPDKPARAKNPIPEKTWGALEEKQKEMKQPHEVR